MLIESKKNHVVVVPEEMGKTPTEGMRSLKASLSSLPHPVHHPHAYHHPKHEHGIKKSHQRK